MRSLALALLLACGACGPPQESDKKSDPHYRWEWLGGALYRFDDQERGVVCYWHYSNLQCLRATIPPVTPEANDAQK